MGRRLEVCLHIARDKPAQKRSQADEYSTSEARISATGREAGGSRVGSCGDFF